MHIPDSIQHIGVGVAVAVLAWVGVALTALTLPGVWIALLVAGLAQWWHAEHVPGEPMFSWWTLGVCAAIAAAGEVIELTASAAGAARAGGGRRGAVGAIVGGFFGAVVGTVAIPVLVVGTLIGAAVGAGVGAVLGERSSGTMGWQHAGKVAAGAAVGRLAASLVKVACAVLVAVILSIAAFV